MAREAWLCENERSGEMNVAGAAGPAGGGEGVGAGAGGGDVGGEGGGGSFVAHPDRLPSIGQWRRVLRRIAKKQRKLKAYESLIVHILSKWNGIDRNQVHGILHSIDKAHGHSNDVLRM